MFRGKGNLEIRDCTEIIRGGRGVTKGEEYNIYLKNVPNSFTF